MARRLHRREIKISATQSVRVNFYRPRLHQCSTGWARGTRSQPAGPANPPHDAPLRHRPPYKAKTCNLPSLRGDSAATLSTRCCSIERSHSARKPRTNRSNHPPSSRSADQSRKRIAEAACSDSKLTSPAHRRRGRAFLFRRLLCRSKRRRKRAHQRLRPRPEEFLKKFDFDFDAITHRSASLAARLKPLSREMKWISTGPLRYQQQFDPQSRAYFTGDALSFVDPSPAQDCWQR